MQGQRSPRVWSTIIKGHQPVSIVRGHKNLPYLCTVCTETAVSSSGTTAPPPPPPFPLTILQIDSLLSPFTFSSQTPHYLSLYLPPSTSLSPPFYPSTSPLSTPLPSLLSTPLSRPNSGNACVCLATLLSGINVSYLNCGWLFNCRGWWVFLSWKPWKKGVKNWEPILASMGCVCRAWSGMDHDRNLSFGHGYNHVFGLWKYSLEM